MGFSVGKRGLDVLSKKTDKGGELFGFSRSEAAEYDSAAKN